MKLEVPTYTDVLKAAARLDGHARPTPVLSHPQLDRISGHHLYLKDETAQKTGTFKYRGAYSRLSAMTEDERRRGVVAFSSGNHAQGVALAAKELGISATIVMPTSAPLKKKRGTLSHGAKLVEYNPNTEDREIVARQIAKAENRVIVPSYDDPYIISGQGTCGLELATHCLDASVKLDAVIMPIGGGGLCAGTSLAFGKLSPQTKIYAAEPFHYDDHYRSLRSGRREENDNRFPSLCDALLSPSPGKITFAINKRKLSGVIRVTDEECLLTMCLIRETTGVVLEPGGAAALTAVLSRNLALPSGSNIAVILSGGNVDEEVIEMSNRTRDDLSIGPAG